MAELAGRPRDSRRRTPLARPWRIHRHWSSDARYRPDRSWVAPIAILAVFAIYGFVDANNAREHYVRPYCLYGAKSQAQFDGCMSHVTSDEINDLDTQAAQFGRGETSDCLDDSGPFCADAAQWNSLDPSDYEPRQVDQ